MTRSPRLRSGTLAPARSTTPAASCPITSGGIRRPVDPSRPWTSLPQIPQARTRISTSSGPISGSSIWTISNFMYSVRRSASILVMLPTRPGNLPLLPGVYPLTVQASFPRPLSGRVGMLAQIASLADHRDAHLELRCTASFDFRAALGDPDALAAVCLPGVVLRGGDHARCCISSSRAPESERVVWSTFRTAGVAVWFAPACILLSQLSPATLLAALVLVITATRLLYSEWTDRAPARGPASRPRPPPGLFGDWTVRPPVFTRELLTGIAAAVSLQAGVISVWRHRPLFAGAWFVLSAAIVTLFAMVSGAVEDPRPPTLPRSVFGMAMAVLLAAGLTVGGLRVARGSGDGEGPGPGAGSGKGAFASAKEVLRDFSAMIRPPRRERKFPAPLPLLPPAGPGSRRTAVSPA